MKRFEEIHTLSPEEFKRTTGISEESFRYLLNQLRALLTCEREKAPMKRRGKKSAHSLKDKLLLTLYYLRHYVTFSTLGQIFGICESYSNKIYHRISEILVKVFHVDSRKRLMNTDLEAILIDVSEQPIERPKKEQKDYYSGKKKHHTIKVQLIVCALTLSILSVFCAKGKSHDFKMLKNSSIAIHPEIKKIVDLGYLGIDKLYTNTEVPFKKPKNGELTPEQKHYNRELARKRIYIEHVNRRCKIFRITKETYRGKHKNYGKTWNLVAGIVNLRFG